MNELLNTKIKKTKIEIFLEIRLQLEANLDLIWILVILQF